jgi:hypothetical protein
MTENTRETATHLVMNGSKFLTADGGWTSDPLKAQPFKDYRNADRNAAPGEVIVRAQVTFVLEVVST